MRRRLFGTCCCVFLTAACQRVGVTTAPNPQRATVARDTPAAPTRGKNVPRDAARFEIDAVDDSTVRFRPLEAHWIRAGMSAYAVDPLRRDALVARLLVQVETGDAMSALVTSQTGRVTTSHFLLVPKPAVPWWRERPFWVGAIAGSALGAAALSLSH